MVKEKTGYVGQADGLATGTLETTIEEVARIVTSTLDINEVYDKFALQVKGIVDFDRIYINVLDEETLAYSVKYMYGLTQSGYRLGGSRSPNGAQTHECGQMAGP